MTPPERGAERARLAEAAAALSLTLSPRQQEQLLEYRDLLMKWNAVYNLTAVRDADAMLEHHLIDCLAVVAPLERLAAQRGMGLARPLRILDVGSGGGLPGVILGIAHPEWQVDCLDAVAKKVAFIRQVALQLQLQALSGVHARVESWRGASGDGAGGYDILISRAYASLTDFVTGTSALLAPAGVWVAMKARLPQEEIAALPPGISVFHVEPLCLPQLDLQRCLVWMEPTPA